MTLESGIDRQCLHEIWEVKKAAGKTDLEDPLLVIGRHNYDLETFFPLFSSYIYNLVDDASSLEYSTKSVVRDFARDGVVYLELRTTPRAMPAAGLDKAGYVEAVLRAIEDVQEESPMLHTRLILSIDRRNTLDEADEVVALAKLFRDRGVVAVDICGDPTKGDVALFTPAIKEAKAAGLKVTVHFAEAEASASEAELSTIMSWMPDRLGHVIHVNDIFERQIIERPGIGLELCLSCNVHANMITGGFEAHHFGKWWYVDGPIVVPCTDDVGVFGSPLSNEWRLIQAHFNLQQEEILGLARKGINAIFAGDDERERLGVVMW